MNLTYQRQIRMPSQRKPLPKDLSTKHHSKSKLTIKSDISKKSTTKNNKNTRNDNNDTPALGSWIIVFCHYNEDRKICGESRTLCVPETEICKYLRDILIKADRGDEIRPTDINWAWNQMEDWFSKYDIRTFGQGSINGTNMPFNITEVLTIPRYGYMFNVV